MFDIKVFCEFNATANSGADDKAFLEVLRSIKQATNARYVNFSVFDYRTDNPKTKHFLTYPQEWLTFYTSRFHFSTDPLLRIDYRRVSHVDWRELFAEKGQERLLDRLTEFGVGNEAVSIVSHGGGSIYCALALVYHCDPVEWRQLKRERMADFRHMADLATGRYKEHYARFNRTNKKLSSRELDVLKFAARGYTDEQIAKNIGIGRWTVVGHMQSIKCKLGCVNRTAAVAKAITLDLISIELA